MFIRKHGEYEINSKLSTANIKSLQSQQLYDHWRDVYKEVDPKGLRKLDQNAVFNKSIIKSRDHTSTKEVNRLFNLQYPSTSTFKVQPVIGLKRLLSLALLISIKRMKWGQNSYHILLKI